MVAPAMEQSGVAHSITLLSPLVVKRVEDVDGTTLGWKVEGSPADSVKPSGYANFYHDPQT